MKKTYAAFYIPKNRVNKKKQNQKLIDKVMRNVTKAIKIAKLVPKKFNSNTIANYFNKNSTSVFAVKYAVSGLCELLTDKKISNKTKRDKFFEILQPVLPLVAYKTGFSDIAALEETFSDDIGNYNLSEFLEFLNDGINARNQEYDNNYTDLGTEIPVDVVESCEYIYSQTFAEHSVPNLYDNNILLSDLNFVKINFTGHIKNPKGELVKTNFYMQKLGDCMKNKQPVILRIGKDVYENCLIENMSPIITNIYELKLVMKLVYSYSGENFTKTVFGGSVLNPLNRSNVTYYLAQQSYAGIFS